MSAFDPEILQDFLTESGELLEQLEGDLVVLEENPRDAEMLNKIFRALHTIKGSASFLALTNLVTLAHAAESALNAARNAIVVVDRPVMDLLLQGVDILKLQMNQLRAGEELVAPRPELVQALAAIGEGKGVAHAPAPAAAHAKAPSQASPASDAWKAQPLTLPPEKADLFEFLVADVDETLAKIEAQLAQLSSGADLSQGANSLADLAESLTKAVDFFDFESMSRLSSGLARHAAELSDVSSQHLPGVLDSFARVLGALKDQGQGLHEREVRHLADAQLLASIDAAISGSPSPQPAPAAGPAPSAPVNEPPQPAKPAKPGGGEDDSHAKKPTGDSTIRVEVGRLEALMNLVGELVLQKNRTNALSRRLAASGKLDQEFVEFLSASASGLDRATSDIQTAVMRTRMQPLEKLFGKYPRLIRDLAAKTGKKMRLVIEGGDTEVDKSVIEELGDPLVHLLRNSADHGIEMPDARAAAKKDPEGTITLRASHEGSHVRILIIDDGKGLDRDRIARKAIERGLVGESALASLSDRDIYAFIFEAGFSTAEKVSDLSGRGVGMDVVRTNIQKIKGSIELSSRPGLGTTISIAIPLTVAILPAMMVAVAEEIYAIPLGNILEIVRCEEQQVSTIGEHPVMRLRDSVLPLISAVDALALPSEPRPITPFAVVLALGDKRIALSVSRLIGQQEVVIKPLDSVVDHRGAAVSGATVRDDGGVSLIVDVAQLFKISESLPAA